MTLTLPNDLINDTTADASPVQQNYSVIEDYINAQVITRDGAVGMQAPLLLVGDPTQPLHAATKAYVDAVLPIGIMMPYGGLAPPGGSWALCNGAALAIADYDDLHNVIGDRFGVAAVGSFLLPNMNGRMPVGVTSAEADLDTVGKSGGTTTPPLIQHQHVITHDHPQFDTGNESAKHQHDDDHNHPAFNVTTPNHKHLGRWKQIRSSLSTADPIVGVFVVSTETPVIGPAELQSGLAADGDATLAIDIPLSSGFLTGTDTVDHHHAANVPNFVGNSGNTVQTAQTKYRPPFMTVSWIIRTK